MIRTIAQALVFVVAFLLVLAEIQRMDDDVTDRIEQQRYINAHQ